MHHASGAEFINTLRETHTHAHTSGEFLMSEDLTGDTEGETDREKGRSLGIYRETDSGMERKLMYPSLAFTQYQVCMGL